MKPIRLSQGTVRASHTSGRLVGAAGRGLLSDDGAILHECQSDHEGVRSTALSVYADEPRVGLQNSPRGELNWLVQ